MGGPESKKTEPDNGRVADKDSVSDAIDQVSQHCGIKILAPQDFVSDSAKKRNKALTDSTDTIPGQMG